MNYTFHPHAEKELEQIEKYYDDILTELGDRFREAVDVAISRIMMYRQWLAAYIESTSLLSIEFLSLRNSLPRVATRNSYLGDNARSS